MRESFSSRIYKLKKQAEEEIKSSLRHITTITLWDEETENQHPVKGDYPVQFTGGSNGHFTPYWIIKVESKNDDFVLHGIDRNWNPIELTPHRTSWETLLDVADAIQQVENQHYSSQNQPL
jgi:hypothetical protein